MGKKDKQLATFLISRIDERLDRAKLARKKVLRNPSTRNTHFLSTSFRRIMVAHGIIKNIYCTRLLDKNEMKTLKQFRTILGSARDAQEISGKFLALNFKNSFAVAFAEDLAKYDIDMRSTIRDSLRRFKLKLLKNNERKNSLKSIITNNPVLRPDKLVRQLLEDVLSFCEAAIMQKSDKALHQLRVRFKAYRYAVEMFTPDFTDADGERLVFLKQIQNALGEAHDWLVLREEAERFARGRRVAGRAAVLNGIRLKCEETHTFARDFVGKELLILEKQPHA